MPEAVIIEAGSHALLERWDGQADEPLFVDGDGDAFQVLLSYMRFGKLTLPQQDEGLCERVLLQAEYLGMDALLADALLLDERAE